MGAFESGQSLMAGVLAKLPEEKRAQAEAIFNDAGAKDAVTLLGDAGLARADYSRSMDGLREKEQALVQYYEQLNTWYGDNRSVIDAARAAQQQRPVQTTGQLQQVQPQQALQSPAAATLTADDVRRIAEEGINAAGKDYIAVSAFIASQSAQHQALFHEPLDALELVNNPKLGKPIVGQPGRVFSLQDAYMEKYGQRVQDAQKQAYEKAFNDEVEKRIAERRKNEATHPFPLRSESSVLDVLNTKEGPAVHTLDTAVAEYERLQAARGA